MPRRSTDPTLWTQRPRFGVAGGPDEVVLTPEGNSRAFAVGAQVRKGPASDALQALAHYGSEAALEQKVPLTAKIRPTSLGQAFDMIAWYHLQALGYVEIVPPTPCRGVAVRLTANGRTAIEHGHLEQARLLERCRRASSDEDEIVEDAQSLRGWRLYFYEGSRDPRPASGRLPVSVIADRHLLREELRRAAESFIGPNEGRDFAIVQVPDDDLPLRAVSRRGNDAYIRAEHH